MAVQFGDFGGFSVNELVLIVSAFLVLGLMYAKVSHVPARARPLLYLLTALFLVGWLLATASNQQVDGRIFAWHALWHVVGAFGFVVLWAYNQARCLSVSSAQPAEQFDQHALRRRADRHGNHH